MRFVNFRKLFKRYSASFHVTPRPWPIFSTEPDRRIGPSAAFTRSSMRSRSTRSPASKPLAAITAATSSATESGPDASRNASRQRRELAARKIAVAPTYLLRSYRLGIALGLVQPQHAVQVHQVGAVLRQEPFEAVDQPGDFGSLRP